MDKSSVNKKLKHWELLTILYTIATSRIVLLMVWNSDFFEPFLDDQWHHMYSGLVILGGLLLFVRDIKVKAVLKGVALGLVFDEITILLHWINIHIDYWSVWSWGSTCIVSLLYVWHELRKT